LVIRVLRGCRCRGLAGVKCKPQTLVVACPGSSAATSMSSANAFGGDVIGSTPSERRCRV
jgi:hypothetical protein